MRIFVNSKSVEVSNQLTLSGFIASLGLESTDGMAVAVNETVVYNQEWNTKILHENDAILIIRATKGG